MGRSQQDDKIRTMIEQLIDERTAALREANERLEREIIERARVEALLRESEERLRLAHKATNDVVWDWDVVHNTQQWNEAGATVLGWTEIVAHPVDAHWWVERVHPDDRQRVEESFFATVDNPKLDYWHDEYRFLKADGSYADVMDRGYVLRDAKGKAVRMIGAMQDITERRQAEEALLKSEGLLQIAGRTARFGGWSLDTDQDTVVWSEEVALIHGKEPGYSPSLKEAIEFYAPEWQERITQIFNACKYEGIPYDEEMEIINVNNQRVWVRTTGEAVRNSEGRIAQIHGSFQDISDRRHTEEALRQSEAMHRNLLQNLNAGVVVHSPDTRILLANQAACDILGLSAEQIIGRLATDSEWRFFYEDGSRMATDDYPALHVLNTRQPLTNLVAGIDRPGSGARVWLLITAFPQFNERQQLQHIVVTFMDITERRRAEIALQEAAELNEKIISESPIGIMIYDETGQCRTANECIAQMIGATKEQVLAQNYNDIKSWQESGMLDAAKSALRERTTKRVVIQLTSTFGKQVCMDCHLVPIERAGTINLLCLLTDITESLRTQEALRESEIRFRNIIDSSPMGIMTYSLEPDGRLVLTGTNPAVREILGSDISLRHGLTIEEAFPPLGQTEVPYRYRRAAEFGESWSSEQVMYEDQQIAGAYEVHAFQTAPGKMAVMFGDITERKRAEAERQKATMELARSNRDLEQFAYVASHDLQEPLRSVVGYLQLIERRYKEQLDVEADEFIEFAVAGARRMQSLINDLLSYSRVGTRGQALMPTDCEQVLERVIACLNTSIAESAVTIRHDRLPTVLGDATQLAQVFQNLIANAIKFRHGQREAVIEVGARQEGTEWIFWVKDNGIGIEPAYHERIFTIFQRLHTDKEFPGTGIGLAICKKIIERHGGRIWVESEFGQGSTFYFTLKSVA